MNAIQWIFVFVGALIVAAVMVTIINPNSGAAIIARQNQCTALMQPVDNNTSVPTMGSTLCQYIVLLPGEQYPPERLPNPQINITVKTIHFLWLGDCKVMTSTGEVYHSAEDQICMAQPGENLTVYQYRTRDNTITDLIQMEA